MHQRHVDATVAVFAHQSALSPLAFGNHNQRNPTATANDAGKAPIVTLGHLLG